MREDPQAARNVLPHPDPLEVCLLPRRAQSGILSQRYREGHSDGGQAASG